ncbi:UEV domain-containing protein [Elsinoe australis]|uniref:UEV domain-containing protein n=1 Tax=Elsinoe australis TaxID=40998 RepID=A0A4U7AKJ5_9PEZI|nr:UEV domain-containing protein [Elsinoe australis]
MAQVPNSTLVWLWDQVQSYSQARLAYNDIAAALSKFPSLQPRTDTYHFENGRPALLVCLSGTIPVDFRGRQYRYPVEIWVPQEYGQPGAGVISYVRPSAGKDSASGMMIRPGQHVAVDGRMYHPYLRDWGIQSRSSIAEFLQIAQGVFAKEPPVVATNQPRTPAPPQHNGQPVLPPKQRQGESSQVIASGNISSPGPPPLPSKPGRNEYAQPQPTNSRMHDSDGPPLPPLPPGALQHQRSVSTGYQNGSPAPQPRLNTDGPPPLPSKHQGPQSRSYTPAQQHQQPTNGAPSPVSPLSPIHRAELPTNRYERPAPLPPQSYSQSGPGAQNQNQQVYPPQGYQQQPYQQQRQAPPPTSAPPPRFNPQQQRQQQPQQSYPPQQYAQPQPQPQALKPPAPAQDLLTDPFDISLAPTHSGPAPPIPPNPEKEHLLTLLSQSLVTLATSQITQSQSALGPLSAQQSALHQAYSTLQSEIHQLQSLDHILATNESILHQSIRDCNAVIESSRKMPQPNIDEVLVAPTIAAQQLWNLCAEEAGIREASWCLQRAVGAGRVSGSEFVRQTRALAREAFLKMALARKVARGLGLEVKGRGVV